MGLNIKNPEVEALATEVARLAHESKTEAIRKALLERKARLGGDMRDKGERLDAVLKRIHARIPPEVRGKTITKEEVEEILGFGPYGY